jgi:indolepyruvate ferredoxin oxidoreductase beta subunit
MKIVITGKGGQGSVLLTRVISVAASLEGRTVISTETHGMAQRGASVISFIKMGDFLSPLIRKGTAGCAFCVLESESSRAVSYLAPKATLFLNSASFSPLEAVETHIEKAGIRVINVNADEEAAALGNARGSNLFLLGYSLPFLPELAKLEAVKDAIRKVLRPQLWDTNLAIVEHAYHRGAQVKTSEEYERDQVLRAGNR